MNKCNNDIVPLFQPSYSPELNPVENLWHHIKEKGGFKNTTFKILDEVETKLVDELKNLDKKIVKSVCQFKWIYSSI